MQSTFLLLSQGGGDGGGSQRCCLCCGLGAMRALCLGRHPAHAVLPGRSAGLGPSLVLTSCSAFAVNGDAVGAADMDEDRPAAGASVAAPAAPDTADGSAAPALPALSSSREAEEAASGLSAPPARAAVLALDALPPG